MHFSKEDMQMVRQTAHEKILNITNHQGNATQNHNDIISHLSGWLATKGCKQRVSKDVDKREPLYIAGGKVNWYIHYVKQAGVFSEN